MPNNARKCVALVKLESTIGVDASPGANDALEVIGLTNPAPDFTKLERDVLNGGCVSGLPKIGSKKQSIEIKVPMRGSGGDATTPPIWMRLLQAAGFDVTVDVASVTATPVGAGTTVTFYFYMDGLLHKFLGAAFVPSFSTEGGPYLTGTLTGKYVEPTTASIPSGLSFDSGSELNGLAPSFVYGGATPILRALSYDFGAQLTERVNINDETGYHSFVVGDYKPSGSMTIEDEALGTKNWRALATVVETTSAEAMSLAYGSGTGNQVGLSFPNNRLTGYSEGAEGAVKTLEIPINSTDSAPAAGDFVSITTS